MRYTAAAAIARDAIDTSSVIRVAVASTVLRATEVRDRLRLSREATVGIPFALAAAVLRETARPLCDNVAIAQETKPGQMILDTYLDTPCQRSCRLRSGL